MNDPLDQFSGGPLTPIEVKKVRKIIRNQERLGWLWAIGRVSVGYVIAVTTTIFMMKDYIVKIIKALSS